MSSFGSTQGTVRYATILDTAQAERSAQTLKNVFTQLGVSSTTTSRNIAGLNQSFTAGVNPIKAQGNALTSLNTNLKANATQVTGLGSKIKTAAGNFSTFAIGLSATTTSVLQLGAGFRDYNDAQIAVDRQTRRVSLAQEALGKANEKLNKLTKEGTNSGKAYKQAQLDVAQAQSFLKTQTELLGERQETLFDTQSQFVASVIPATLGAVGTLGAAFKSLGGDQGIGGLSTKFKGLGSSITGLGGGIKTSVVPAIAGLIGGGGIGGLTDKLKGAITSAGGLSSALAGIALPVALAGGGALLILDDIRQTMEKLDKIGLKFTKTTSTLFDVSSVELMNKSTAELNEVLGKTGASLLEFRLAPEGVMKRFLAAGGQIDKFGNIVVTTVKKSVQATSELKKAHDALADSITKLIMANKSRTKSDNEVAAIQFQLARHESLRVATLEKVTELTNEAAKSNHVFGISSGEVDDALKKAAPTFTEVKDVFASMGEGFRQNAIDLGLLPPVINKNAEVIQGFGKNVDQLAEKFLALSGSPVKTLGTMGLKIKEISGSFQGLNKDQKLFMDLISNWNPTAIKNTNAELLVTHGNMKKIQEITRQLVTKANDLQPAFQAGTKAVRDLVAKTLDIQEPLKKATEEAKKFTDILASSDEAFKGVFKIETNVDKIFKDLVKGLPNKLEKKLKLQFKFEQNVDDAKIAFRNFLGKAIEVKDSDADKMAKVIIDSIDKNFKGKKGAFAGLRQSLVEAIKSAKTPEELQKILSTYKWTPVEIPSTLIPPPPVEPPKDPVKVPSTFIPPPPPPAPKKEVPIPSIFKTPPPIPPPSKPVIVPSNIESRCIWRRRCKSRCYRWA